MTKFSKDELDLHKIYDKLFETMVEMILTYKDTQKVASTMMSQALRLYKSILTDGEFKEMIRTIAEKSKNIQPFEEDKTIH